MLVNYFLNYWGVSLTHTHALYIFMHKLIISVHLAHILCVTRQIYTYITFAHKRYSHKIHDPNMIPWSMGVNMLKFLLTKTNPWLSPHLFPHLMELLCKLRFKFQPAFSGPLELTTLGPGIMKQCPLKHIECSDQVCIVTSTLAVQ